MKKHKFIFISILHLLLFFNKVYLQEKIDVWKIKANKIDKNNYYGITVSNGMIGLVSSPKPLQIKEVVLANLYDNYGRGRVSNFIRGFQLLNLRLIIDGILIDENNIINFEQELDMKKGIFTVRFDVFQKAKIEYSYTALRHLPFLTLLDFTIKPLKKIQVQIANIIEAPDVLKNVQNTDNKIDRPHVLIHLLSSTAKTPTDKNELAVSSSFLFNEAQNNQPPLIHEMWDNNMHLLKFNKQLNINETYNFGLISSTISSSFHPDPLNEAERLTIFGVLEGKQNLWKKHNKAWEELWQSRIEIIGDDSTQQNLNSMIYHLYAFNREGSVFSTSPMGLSGLGYNGHIFWDTELWIYPPLLLLNPLIAKGMIEYRINLLNMAKKNAFINGYKGAMFPWESANTGVEETPVWALSGPFEHHITACVAIATWNYFCVTQDTLWLKLKAWELLKSTAEFWESRVEKDSNNKYHINNVVAADEWAENVNDNAFTNAAAKNNLQIAIKAAILLNLEYPKIWNEIANNLVFETMQNGIMKEHQSYNGENIKQADVNLLSYPLKEIYIEKDILNNLEYYNKRLPDIGTPSMTQSIFATLYARFNQVNKAYYWFNDAFKNNLNPPFNVIAETKGGKNPYFATAAGGILQSILMGFGGLEITNNGIQKLWKTTLPSNWKQLSLIGIGKEKITYTIKNQEK